MRLLSYATHYWSKGTIKSLFLEHEVNNSFLFSLLRFIILFVFFQRVILVLLVVYETSFQKDNLTLNFAH